MKSLVIYDSVFGNTEKVAFAIGGALGSEKEAAVMQVKQVRDEHIKDVDILVVGSPTRAFKHTEAIGSFIRNLPAGSLSGVKVAAFDTRVDVKKVNSGFLNFMVKMFGYAAEPIADKLRKKGGSVVLPAAGFIVGDTEGPLREGELERAADWARNILVIA